MYDRPGFLQPVYRTNDWLDLVLKSDLDMTTKVVAVVVARSAQYNTKAQLQLTNISDYSIGRIIKANKSEVQEKLDILFENGWLHDTGVARGARKVYALTFSLLPNEMRK